MDIDDAEAFGFVEGGIDVAGNILGQQLSLIHI